MTLELADVQATVLRNRPMPYCGACVFMRIDDPQHARTLLSRLIPKVTTSADWKKPIDHAWINIVFTHAGLARLGVPQEILDGFPLEFRVPMANRKEYLGDTGESDPAHWDYPFGSTELHTSLMVMAPDRPGLEAKLAIGRGALLGLPGVEVIGQLDVALPASFREHFGFADGISRPFIDGQGGTPLPGQGEPFKAGEFSWATSTNLMNLPKGRDRKHFGETRRIYRSVSFIKMWPRSVAFSGDAPRLRVMKS